MESSVKTHHILPLTSVCHHLRRRLCSPKACWKRKWPRFSSSRSILKPTAAPWIFSVQKARMISRGLIQRSLAHTLQMLGFFFLTSLPSSHQAVLRSPRLNELTSMDGWEEEESVRRSGLFHKRFNLRIRKITYHSLILSPIRSK